MVAAHPDFVVFNGRVNRYDINHPIPIKVGKLVRIFFLDAGPNLSSTVHISGVIFSTVYPSGNPANVIHGVGSLDVAPSQGAVLEFTASQPGNYVLSDLSRAHGYKGAMAILRATP
jgi:nitrite reductase (NO-forming)